MMGLKKRIAVREEKRGLRMLRQRLFDYAKEKYGVEPDYPFSTAPTYPVLRHADTRKWFAIFMDVPRARLGLAGDGSVDVVNVKCDAMAGALRRTPGILPAYHMNREKWVTVLLDGTVPAEEICPLLDLSYSLTASSQDRGADFHSLSS